MKTQACRVAFVAAFLLLAFPAQALADSFSYSGEAFGSRVKVGSTITSGASALASVGCSSTAPVVSSNTAAGINVPSVAVTGAITDQVSTADDGVVRSTSASSTVNSVNLLSGLITADAVTAAGATSWSASSFSFTNTSTFSKLVVAGQSLSATVSPNTKITLTGIGYVMVNESSSSVVGVAGRQTINALHVVVTEANSLGVAVGTDILIAHTLTGFAGPIAARVGGSSYGTYAAIYPAVGPTVVLSGTSFEAKAPCVAGTATNSAAGMTLPTPIGSTGTIVDTATTTHNVGSSQADTSSEVQNVNLLSGLIQASVVTATAQAASDGVTPTFTDSGSITGLVVNGSSVSVTGSATISIAGLGTLYVHRIVQVGNLIEVRGLELLVNQANVYGLAWGTSVRIAVARASIL